MKIRQLLERRDYSEPASCEIEFEDVNSQSDPDVEDPNYYMMVRVNGVITHEFNVYGERGSPDEHTFEPTEAFEVQSGKPFDMKRFSESDWKYIYAHAQP